MESPIRQTESSIEKIEQYDFFEYLYLLEKNNSLKNMKLSSSSQLGFSATDLNEKGEINWMGLYGVDSPLPHYFLWTASREDEEGKILRDFLDIFNNRLYQLFYFSLKKYQPGINRFFYARVKSRVGLKALLRNYFRDIAVEVKTFIPEWREVENKEKYILGENTILGSRILDLSSKIEIEIGPLPLERGLLLKNNKNFINLINSYCSFYIDYKICLLINIPKGINFFILGWMCWLGEPQTSLVQIML